MAPVDLLALLAGSAILLATGILGAAALRIPGRAGFVAASLILSAATVVATSTALSLLELWQRGPVLIAQAVVLGFVAIWWALSGRPSPPLTWIPSRQQIWASARRHRTVALFVSITALAVVVEAALALTIAPNNFDSMTYHLARIGYWLQYDSVLQFADGTQRQIEFPPNAEILQGWTMLITDGDRFAQLVQVMALIGIGCTIFLGARLLDFSRSASAFAAALFMTMPQPVLQSTTTQNDLIVSFFVSAGAVFLLRGVLTRSRSDLAISAVALGLAVGTKGTAFLAIPAVLLVGAAALVLYRPPRRAVVKAGIGFTAAALVLGGTNYIQNAVETGNPLGSAGSGSSRTEPLITNAAYLGWNLIDFPGLESTWVARLVQERAQVALGSEAENLPGDLTFPVTFDVETHEDFAAYGPIGLFVLSPLLLAAAFGRRSPWRRRWVALSSLAFVIGFAVSVQADAFSMRLLMPAVALGALLLARVEEVAWLRHATAVTAILVLGSCLFYNDKKPIGFTDPLSFLRADRLTQQTPSEYLVPYYEQLQRLNNEIPPDARVVLNAPFYSNRWEYPLFGPHFDRYVWRTYDAAATVPAARRLMDEGGFDAVVWITPPEAVPKNNNVVDLGLDTYYLLPANPHSG